MESNICPNRYYKMTHKYRGSALILNHYQFDDKELNTRSGTHVDANRLREILQSLGFRVKVGNDLTLQEIMCNIKEIAKMDHLNNDCLFIAVLTHGDPGKLYAQDTHYPPEHLYRHFTDQNCPTLAGKPKLFFFQACQGSKLDDGITLKIDDYEADFSPELPQSIPKSKETASTWYESVKNPSHVDFLVTFSTVPGYYSWRNARNGSWFIQMLCEELEYEAKTDSKRDILNILTVVSQRVALNYESDVTNNAELSNKKQVPCINSMLRRLLVFEKKMKSKSAFCV